MKDSELLLLYGPETMLKLLNEVAQNNTNINENNQNLYAKQGGTLIPRNPVEQFKKRKKF